MIVAIHEKFIVLSFFLVLFLTKKFRIFALEYMCGRYQKFKKYVRMNLYSFLSLITFLSISCLYQFALNHFLLRLTQFCFLHFLFMPLRGSHTCSQITCMEWGRNWIKSHMVVVARRVSKRELWIIITCVALRSMWYASLTSCPGGVLLRLTSMFSLSCILNESKNIFFK